MVSGQAASNVQGKRCWSTRSTSESRDTLEDCPIDFWSKRGSRSPSALGTRDAWDSWDERSEASTTWDCTGSVVDHEDHCSVEFDDQFTSELSWCCDFAAEEFLYGDGVGEQDIVDIEALEECDASHNRNMDGESSDDESWESWASSPFIRAIQASHAQATVATTRPRSARVKTALDVLGSETAQEALRLLLRERGPDAAIEGLDARADLTFKAIMPPNDALALLGEGFGEGYREDEESFLFMCERLGVLPPARDYGCRDFDLGDDGDTRPVVPWAV